MSRIGKQLIEIPSGVSVDITGSTVNVKGSKGDLEMTIHPAVIVEQIKTGDGTINALQVTLKDEEQSAIWGTMRALLANMVKGVSQGWTKRLELNGVGFKMNLTGKMLKMQLGYSHESVYELPVGIEASIEGNMLTITGADKQAVGEVAAEIRALKKPEPYKGKGFKYDDEVIRRKAGKTAKTE